MKRQSGRHGDAKTWGESREAAEHLEEFRYFVLHRLGKRAKPVNHTPFEHKIANYSRLLTFNTRLMIY